MPYPDLDTLHEAADRIRPYAHVTPVLTSRTLNAKTGGQVFFKCENFQRCGAFKFRGALNAVLSLGTSEARHGVVTHSSGNHAAALALAARQRGIPAHIVMPATASPIKRKAVAGYGGEIVLCAPNLKSREATARRVQEQTDATLIHPYNDLRIIAGQATAALELLGSVPDLDLVLAPVGGGGLLSGTALAVRALAPETRVIAAEPAGADDAYRSLKAGRIVPSIDPKTIADGLLTSLGELTFPIIRDLVEAIVTVDDPAIIAAMRTVWERMKIIIEPSAAVPVAALLEGKVKAAGKRIGVILSGGNVNLDRLPFSPGPEGA